MIKITNTNKLDKALRRDRKRKKNQYGMKRDGDSVKVIQREQEKRKDAVIQKRRRQKQEYLELAEEE